MFKNRCYNGGSKHKFEARYEQIPNPSMEELKSLKAYGSGLDKLVLNRYVKDICTWCGKSNSEVKEDEKLKYGRDYFNEGDLIKVIDASIGARGAIGGIGLFTLLPSANGCTNYQSEGIHVSIGDKVWNLGRKGKAILLKSGVEKISKKNYENYYCI